MCERSNQSHHAGQPATELKTHNMKKVTFRELDTENKLTAVSQMFAFKEKNNWPSGAVWSSEEDLWTDLEQDWNADEYFSFYLNENDEVETKIG